MGWRGTVISRESGTGVWKEGNREDGMEMEREISMEGGTEGMGRRGVVNRGGET